MIGVTIQEGESIDRALRRFKKKYERAGVIKEYKRRTAFTKPSINNRMARLKAIRRQLRISREME
ncbi:MAG: 30S ribosomal protein S21 [Chlorobi bacterium]|nr:MAG: 30S ribosomal protein S21 [Chlorobi bacterium OLB7]MBK8910340.1 30S ribosomal protein S21 [Chlorobiota bacterium]MBL7988111.1 30S ribosomal protein S21 [Chlorobiota bacterium]MBX7217256.1 30S ribosomal protein S21 [Candidatus Kapabacteria bacterium]MCC7438010.1 30S ribosomal protein S21 [Armatimonadota bacterium]